MALLNKPKPAPELLGKLQIWPPDGDDEEAENQPSGNKVSTEAAGYMELAGAKKDGDCRIVQVEGGISKDLGCCNLFFPESKKVQKFSCGTCHFED